MVDAESVARRIDRLGPLLEVLEETRARGRAAYDDDLQMQLATHRALQLAIQICVDVGAHLVAELGLRPPSEYRDVFKSLREIGLDRELAERLEDAAGQRNVLVHLYLEIDDKKVWESLGRLDDLRAFAAWAEELARKEG